MDDEEYDLGGEQQAEQPKRPGLPVEPRRLARILVDHRRVLGTAFLIAAALSVLAFFLLPTTYEAEAVLLYEGAPVLDAEGTPPSQDAFVQSAEVPSRLLEVRERLGWDVPIEDLEESIEAEATTNTSMHIKATMLNAEDAFALADATLDVFMEHQVAFNAAELERLIEHNQSSLEHARTRLDEAQKAFDGSRAKSGSRDIVQERAQLLERAAGLRVGLDEAQVEVSAQQALIAELEDAQSELPRQVVASAKRASVVEGPLATAKAELARAQASLSEEHPRVRALRERVAQLEARRGKERSGLNEQMLAMNPARTSVDRELASARAALAAAQERSTALAVLLAEIERKAEDLSPEEGEARRVLNELNAATERVAALTQRKAELRDAALAPINRFRILSAPVLPEEASRSGKVVALLFLFPFVAVFGVALVVLLIALRTLRVQAPREVAWWGKGPVLGTTVWPRRPDALQGFVDELEDQGVHAGGRTLVIPATENERDDACAFAMKLAEAPWLAAAILDVGDRADPSIVTPPPSTTEDAPIVTPSPIRRPRRLSADATPGIPAPVRVTRSPTRPPRKRTVIGLPAVGSAGAKAPSQPVEPAAPMASPTASADGPQPFRRKRGARATIRMIIPAGPTAVATDPHATKQEEAFLLTRPLPTREAEADSRVGPAVLVSEDAANSETPNSVMRAAVRLLGEGNDDITEIRASAPPSHGSTSTALANAVALAWNGPLSGPVLRRAARLAHRVIVVVSSGASVVDLARVRTRLGREEGVGYVLIKVDDAFAEVEDRVGPVEDFWHAGHAPDS